jgi:hypothetical protein
MINPRPFQCEYCQETFVREKAYTNHKCDKKRKYERLQTYYGQLAWEYYQHWMKLKRHAVHNKIDTFISSRYFNSLFLFAEHVKKVNIPSTDLFIRLMIKRDYPPTMWCSDDTYAEYLEFLDRQATPRQQLNITLHTFKQLCDKYNINDISTIFSVIPPIEIINLIKQRKLSPWVLLRSKKFTEFFSSKLSREQQRIIKAIIRFDYWKEKFDQYKEDLKIIDESIIVLQL